MTARIFKIITIVFIIIIIFSTIFFAYPALTEKEEVDEKNSAEIIRIWNVDTFEGGKGSRSTFLSSVAVEFEKQNKNCFIMVIPHTVTSVKTAIENGESPDIMSFGTGGAVVSEKFLPIEHFDCKYSRQDKITYAVPWCRGGYFLFTIDGDFSDVSSDNTIISEGKNSLAKVAATLEGVNAQNSEPSVSAYVSLINGKYKYMVGTQRDVARLNTRGVSYKTEPFKNFSEIYQYASIICNTMPKYNLCVDFIKFLTSRKIQEKLRNIGMMSCFFNIYDSDNLVLHEGEKINAKQGISAFSSESLYSEMYSFADKALKGDLESLKKLKNFLI